MGKLRLFNFITLLFISSSSFAGFIGGGVSFNSSKTFDKQKDGFRLDFGSHANSVVDLEFTLVDFGESSFNDPTFVEAQTPLDTDLGSFENIGFGSVSSSDGGLTFTGIKSLNTFGIGTGLKLRKSVNTWLQVYAKASFLAWESTAEMFKIYSPRPPQNSEGNVVALGVATNQNPCGTFTECRQPSQEIKHQAVDFWYGYGFIIKPLSWLAIRTEYSITTLNAVDFPKSVIEGVTASLEVHF
jgi:opacity protein-like surface antigen